MAHARHSASRLARVLGGARVAPTGKSVGTEAREEWHGKIETLVREWDEAHGLEIGPETNEPLWDGSAMDYGDAVSGLVAG